MSQEMMQRTKRTIALAVLVSFVFSGVLGLGILFSAQPALAQVDSIGGPANVSNVAVGAAQRGAQIGQKAASNALQVKSTTWDSVKIVLANTAAIALLNAVQYFLQKIAYETANYIASGGKAQSPLFNSQTAGDFFKSTLEDAAGEAIGTISQEAGFEKLGINLCSPTIPRVALNIQLGFLDDLRKTVGKFGANNPQPKCSWNQISSNWDSFANTLDSNKALDNVGVMFTGGQSPLSAAIEFNRYTFNAMDQKKQGAASDQQSKGGFKDLTEKISGKIKTPAEAIKQKLNDTQKQAGDQSGKNVMITGDAFKQGAYAVLASVLQTFAGTLIEGLSKQIFDKGFISANDLLGHEQNLAISPDASSTGGRTAAELSNANLLTPKILTLSNYNAMLDFSTCSSDAPKLPNNCVVDSQFYNAVARADQGAPITVKQAIEQGFINGGWRLIPLSHPKNLDRNCYLDAFCYSNLVKLRLARVLPIGWELAANSPFNDVNSPVTLKEAMDRFNDCPLNADGTLNTAKLPDPLHPWCHLIDPDWVLRYPTSICRQQAPGPIPVSASTSNRASICTDSQSCIATDDKGNCLNYGYCTREKSAWKFDADACPAEYASCQAFKDANGQAVSYLLNTVEVNGCNADNAGCRQYSLSQNALPNGGFEDVLNGAARGWTGGSRLDKSGTVSLAGSDALGVTSVAPAHEDIPSILSGKQYALAAAAFADASSTPANGTMTISFKNRDGNPAGQAPATGAVSSDCAQVTSSSVTVNVSVTHFGYQSSGCTVTTPSDAVRATVTLSTNATVTVWFDELGMRGDSYSADPYESIFMNAKVQSCSADKVGCSEFVRASSGTLNLIRDPGFEEREAAGNAPKYWTMGAGSTYEGDLFKGFEGSSSVLLGSGAVTQDVTGLIPNAAYAFSVYSKHDDDNPAPTGRLVLTLHDNAGNPVPLENLSGCSASGNDAVAELAVGSEYQRNICAFTTPSDTGYLTVSLVQTSQLSSRLVADAAQLELGVSSSSYHDGYDTSAEHVMLQAAPAHMGCNGLPTDPATCKSFAPVCRRDEVGCNSYTPKDGGTSVPAVVSPSDICPAECNGYDSYRQEPTSFADAAFPKYLIPSTAASCTIKEAGCEEFTNLEKLNQGGEAREYFTYLRYCQKPDQQTGTYYTWEGDEQRGYQLRSWTLRNSQIQSAVSTADPTGGTAPCTTLRYDGEGNPICADTAGPGGTASCDKAQASFNPDCREFYDVNGNIHYRFYSKTVLVSDTCTEYRMTEANETDCTAHGGLWERNECHYFAFAPESTSCQASANKCTGYTGNASRNIRVVMNDDFEDGTRDGWGPDAADGPSSESVTAGGQSLRVIASDVSKPLKGAVQQNKEYLLTFWAKGSGDLDVFFGAVAGNPGAVIALSTDWKAYNVGPFQLDHAPTDADALHLVTANPSAAADRPMFIDNIVLKEIADSVYVIRDSWKTPASCDQAPNGVASPQYMLGCRAYKDRDSTTVYLKSFSRLCSDKAVGCQAFYDTHNTSSPFAQAYNAVCKLGSACVPSGGALTCSCAIGGTEACEVTRGATSCYYDSESAVADANVSPSGDTVRVPDDNLVYMVDDPAFHCTQADQGCTQVGDKTLNPDGDVITGWTAKTILNLPADYSKSLCQKPDEFCQAYTRAEDGGAMYFKDPGNHACEFKSSATVNGVSVSGWFKKGTDEPCYSNFFQGGTFYGIWRNDDAQYDKWVGMCPRNFSMCKEFLDPADKSASNPKGQPYYAILNGRLDSTICQGQVSRSKSPNQAKDASACVLFDQTDNVRLTYDSSSTYEASDAKFGELVDASSGANNDANIIIKVQRDRQCAEWLDCRTSKTVFNPSSGQFQNVCTGFGLCAEYKKVGDSTRCVKFITDPNTGTVLDAKTYASRPVGWDGLEYSGYSIPNRYPVEELVTVDLGTVGKPDPRLVYARGSCSGADGSSCGSANNLGNTGVCFSKQCVWPIDGSKLPVTTGNARSALQETQTKQVITPPTCRAYPDENAPFPSTVADPGGWDTTFAALNGGNPVLTGGSGNFANANICQRRLVQGVEVGSCECSYYLATYGGSVITKYLPTDGPDLPAGYCAPGSTYEGLECDPLATGLRTPQNHSCCSKVKTVDDGHGGTQVICAEDATCKRLSKVDQVIGYEGQCLEYDRTTNVNNRPDQFACATWRPVGLVGGTRDIYNLYQSSGYFASFDKRYYCALPSGTSSVNISNKPYTVGLIGPAGENRLDLGIDPVVDPVNGSPQSHSDFAHKVCYHTGSLRSDGKTLKCISDSDCRNVDLNGNGVIDNNGSDIETDFGPCVPQGVCRADHGFTCWNSDGDQPTFSSSFCDDHTGNDNCDPPTVSSDPLGGGEMSDQGPRYQPADRFFGPGTVNIMFPNFVSSHGTCEDGDTARWCIFPGLSTTCLPSTTGGGSCGNPDYYALRDPVSYGIVGCYEFADGTPGTAGPPTIQWPYIGPPIYKDQLQAFYVHLVSNLYGNTASGNQPNGQGTVRTVGDLTPTNPHQHVTDNCNDDGDDSHINGDKYCYLTDANKWLVDCADKGGQDTFKLSFDDTGKISSLTLTVKDDNDSGTFGIKSIGFMFQPLCKTLDRVDVPGEFGLTRADTDVVNSERNFLRPSTMTTPFPDPAPVGTTSFAQACTPWGAVGWQTQDPAPIGGGPSRWSLVALYPDAPVSCSSSNDCQNSKLCIGGFCAEAAASDCSESSSRHASSYTAATLPSLFRQTFGAWQLGSLTSHSVDFSGGLNTALFTYSGGGYDNTANGSGVVPPHIASVDTAKCSSDGLCPVKTVDHLTLNGRDNGIIPVQGGVYQANAQFYAWGSTSQMPVRQQHMIWGDNAATEPPADGWYKNQKPYCSPDTSDQHAIGECSGTGIPPGLTCRQSTDCPNGGSCVVDRNHFGDTPGACTAGQLKFDHTYTCSLADLAALSTCSGFDPATDRALNTPCKRLIGNAWNCVYRPAVQIIDNWDWCNCTGDGTACPGGVAGGVNDSAGACTKADFSKIKTNGPWTAFDGEIRLQTTDLENALFTAAGGGTLPLSVYKYVGGTGSRADLPANFLNAIAGLGNP